MLQILRDVHSIQPCLHCLKTATPCQCWQLVHKLPLGSMPSMNVSASLLFMLWASWSASVKPNSARSSANRPADLGSLLDPAMNAAGENQPTLNNKKLQLSQDNCGAKCYCRLRNKPFVVPFLMFRAPEEQVEGTRQMRTRRKFQWTRQAETKTYAWEEDMMRTRTRGITTHGRKTNTRGQTRFLLACMEDTRQMRTRRKDQRTSGDEDRPAGLLACLITC